MGAESIGSSCRSAPSWTTLGRGGGSSSGRDTSSRTPRGRPTRVPRPPLLHHNHLLRVAPPVNRELIEVDPRRGLLSRTGDIPVPIGTVRAAGRAAAGQLEIVQGLARALKDRHGTERR